MTPAHRASGDVLDQLAAACGARFARPAGPADEVVSGPARWVAVPGDVAAVSAVLRVAAEHDLALVIRGAGSKLHWGAAPSQVDVLLDTWRLAGVEHQPTGHPTARIGAGTRLREAQEVLGRTGWRLPLDAPSEGATIGGVVAADESGPLNHRHGCPCRQLVEVAYVDASGVPGQSTLTTEGTDLGHLLCGSQGALAVLVSATLRVHRAPAGRLWVCRSVRTPLEVHDLVQEVLGGSVRPAAVEVDLPGAPDQWLPRQRRTPISGALAVLIEGDPTDTRRRAEQVTALLAGDATSTTQAPHWWRRYPFGADDIALRLEVPVAHLHAAIYALRDAAGAPVAIRGSAGLGLVHAVLPATTAPDRVAAILAAVRTVLLARGGSCVVLTAPPAVRGTIDIWGEIPELTRLRQVKERFDPRRRLAPGRFLGDH